MTDIQPVILSGGSGKRLWPLSRTGRPKQFLCLEGLPGKRGGGAGGDCPSLLQTTVRRASGPGFLPPIVVAAEEHRFLIAEQLREIGVEPAAILLEPVARNTAPAIAAAALKAQDLAPGALALVLPADHDVTPTDAFVDAVKRAAGAAAGGRIVTFGIPPESPHTGFGYIRAGAPIDGAGEARAVASFKEKPDRPTAETYLTEGGYFWNAGIFLFSPQVMLDELTALEPGIRAAAKAALVAASVDLDFLRLERSAFEKAPKISIDYAVMERTDRAALVPLDVTWRDLGTWQALWERGPRDRDGNLASGDVHAEDVAGSVLRAGHGTLIAKGLRDMIVVTEPDAVLVLPLEQAEEIKGLLEGLKGEVRERLEAGPQSHRPWGHFETITEGPNHLVKRLVVKPGGRLSLQKHQHRAEHWVVVGGVARVTKGDEVFDLVADQSTYIPQGTVHRLENLGDVSLEMIEVQTGSLLSEDDIIRLEDTYGRDGVTAESSTQ